MTTCEIPVRDSTFPYDVVSIVFSVLALIFVALRLLTRTRWFQNQFGWQDLLIIIAEVGHIVTIVERRKLI